MFTINLKTLATALGSALLLVAGSAQATTITTASTTTWSSTSFISGTYYTLNFYPVSASSYNTSPGISLKPDNASTSFAFTGYDNGSFYLAGDRYAKTLSSSTDSGAYINIGFGAPENAFLLGLNGSSSRPLTITFSDGEVFSVTSTIFGASLSHNITSLTISAAAGSQASVSDFWYAASSLPQDSQGGTPAPSPTPTPEPTTILLTLVGGMLSWAGSRKRLSTPKN